jgi:hypothetical protein
MFRSLGTDIQNTFESASAASRLLTATSMADPFIISVNNDQVTSDRADCIALSPAVREQLSVDACAQRFIVESSELSCSDFSNLYSLLSGTTNSFSAKCWDNLFLLAGQLGNPSLESLFFPFAPEEFDNGFAQLFSTITYTCTNLLLLCSVEALDSILTDTALPIEDEDSLFLGILSLGPNYLPLLRHVQWQLLSPGAINEFEGSIAEEILEPVLHRVLSDSVRSSRLNSMIVSELPPILNQFQNNSFHLLWRGSRDGFAADDFHSRCDGHRNTLTLISDWKGNIFGGFTPLPWASSGHPRSDVNKETFMFTIKNPCRVSPCKFALKHRQKGQAISYVSSRGPVFGNGALCIADRCNLNSCSHTSAFNGTFKNHTQIDGAILFTGARGFCVDEIEVFEIKL